MSKVAIITDSVSCIPKQLIDEYDIRIVPVNVIIDGKSYRDGVDISATELYTQLKHLKKVSTTSTPSPGQFLELYEELSEQTSDIIVITVSSQLSAVHSAASQTMELGKTQLAGVNINIVDSKTAAGAEGFVVIAAARAAANGLGLADVTQAAENMMQRVHMLGMLDTLHYLAKNGRVKKAAAWASAIFRVKPILHISPGGGEVSFLAKTRTKRKGIELLINLMRERDGNKNLHLNIQHANALDDAKSLKERIENDFNCAEVYITDFTPVMGAATGPSVLCLSFYSE